MKLQYMNVFSTSYSIIIKGKFHTIEVRTLSHMGTNRIAVFTTNGKETILS